MTVTNAFLLPENPVVSLDDYLSMGGGQVIAKALAMPREQIISETLPS